MVNLTFEDVLAGVDLIFHDAGVVAEILHGRLATII